MYSIPNTSIPFQTYDADAGRIPALQSWFLSQPIVGGYLFCSTQAVYVRLSVGSSYSQSRKLPEFFLPPGAQGIAVDHKAAGNPVWAIEVRAATGTVPQFWGALSTEYDPVGGFTPASYSVDINGSVIPVVITLAIEKDGAGVGNAQILNFLTVGGVGWAPALLAGNQVNLPVPPIGFQLNDGSQHNEVIADFENPTAPNPGVVFTLTDDPGNNRMKIAGKQSALITHDQYTADVTITGTTDATATTIVSSTSKTYDGVTPVLITCYTERTNFGAASATTLTYCLFRDGTEVGRYGQIVMANGQTFGPCTMIFRETPTNAAHVYSLRAFGNITGIIVGGGAAGGAAAVPGFIRAQYDV